MATPNAINAAGSPPPTPSQDPPANAPKPEQLTVEAAKPDCATVSVPSKTQFDSWKSPQAPFNSQNASMAFETLFKNLEPNVTYDAGKDAVTVGTGNNTITFKKDKPFGSDNAGLARLLNTQYRVAIACALFNNNTEDTRQSLQACVNETESGQKYTFTMEQASKADTTIVSRMASGVAANGGNQVWVVTKDQNPVIRLEADVGQIDDDTRKQIKSTAGGNLTFELKGHAAAFTMIFLLCCYSKQGYQIASNGVVSFFGVDDTSKNIAHTMRCLIFATTTDAKLKDAFSKWKAFSQVLEKLKGVTGTPNTYQPTGQPNAINDEGAAESQAQAGQPSQAQMVVETGGGS